MVSAWQIKNEIESFIELVALSSIERFYPTAVAKHTGFPLGVVFDYLIELSSIGQLLFIQEIRCPNYGCTRNVNVQVELGETILCDCGKEFMITHDLIFPAFELNPEYREYIRNKSKKKAKNRISLTIITN